MGRILGSVVGGYVAIFAVVFVLFSLAYEVLGSEGAFQPGTYDVSTAWVLLSFVLGFVGAVAGGWVAAQVAGSQTGPRALAIVVVGLGLLLAIPAVLAEPETVARTGEVGLTEAMREAHTPAWVALLNPVVGAIGVLLGGRLRGRASGNAASGEGTALRGEV